MKVYFGAFAPKLKDQLGNIKDVSIFQEDTDNITRLMIRGLITISEADKARMRLIKKIEKSEGVHR